MSKTQLVLLGTGSPSSWLGRYQSAAAVVVDDRAYVIDCGAGVVQRLVEARAQGVEAFAFPKLTRLFLTHLHPDHTTGMADFIIAPWVMGRQQPLLIYGPKGSQKMAKGLLDVYKIGIDEHLYGISPLTHPLLVQAKDYEAGEIYRDQWVTIEAFRVQHGNLDAFGFKVVTADKSIVFSGDTCPVPALIEHAQGCDILVHEVYCHASLYEAHPQWIGYFTQVHTSGIELAEIAKQVQPKLLVLTHQMSWGDYSKADLMKEITDGYDGEVVYGNDLDVFN